MKENRICCQKICILRNAKGNSLGWREMIQREAWIFREE
jgi:hypothetical protein